MMGKRLDGRRVLLTGVSRGVGFETAKRFLGEGAKVFGVAKDPARLERASRELSALGDFTGLAVDLVSPGAPELLAGATRDRWEGLDILFHNAAILADTGGAKTFHAEPRGTLERTLDINLLAPFRLTMELLPQLRRGHEPRIVHVGSGAGTVEGVTLDGIASYRLSKWALHGLTRMLASQLAGEISVQAFDPGWVKTDLGGPNAPGSPRESAEGALAVATLPFASTGKFWKDGHEIPF
ncbi:MAG TPA: SDR family NAD(P)-dependent oxidoreductase [Polyangiaceae bacterium]|jgi:NAD(P)-dependent dehydrogenase (short-subunit alcohol dehydrogenase family)